MEISIFILSFCIIVNLNKEEDENTLMDHIASKLTATEIKSEDDSVIFSLSFNLSFYLHFTRYQRDSFVKNVIYRLLFEKFIQI